MTREETLKKMEELRQQGKVLYSFSRLSSFNDCLFCYNETYNKGDRGKDNIYALIGTSLHNSLEDIYNDKDNQLKENYNNDYKKAKEQGFDFPTDKIKENYDICINHYIDNFKKDELNSLTEYPFLIEVNGEYIIGFIDRVTKDPNSNENTLRVIDYKTSTRYAKKDLVEKGRQLVLYAYALEQITGKKVTSCCWNMLKYAYVKCKLGSRKKAMIMRNEIVLKYRDEILQAIEDKGYEFDEALDIYMDNATKNKIPDEVKDYFEITDGYVEYPYNEETKTELLEYLHNTIKKIKSHNNEWKPKSISLSNEFLCLHLCSHRDKCPALSKYMNNIPEIVEEETELNFEELF